MSEPGSIAIVGGGPAGAFAAERLARAGREVLVFDEKLAWEKPCGGGLTYKALEQFPFLAAAGSPGNPVDDCELISPSGKRVRFQMRHPVAIFSRRELNGLVLERAQQAGARVLKERVTRIERSGKGWKLHSTGCDYDAEAVIMAAGARNPFRAQFLTPFSSEDLLVTAGYFIPGRTSLLQIQFLKEIAGYIWVFPRADHVSAGIAARMGEVATSQLRRRLESWLHESGFSLEGATFYSHILPALRTATMASLRVCGDGWAMLGDSAGLVDPITGEGLYYALKSAELCSDALLAGRLDTYQEKLEEEVLPELRLAARVSQRFYRGQIFGDSVVERMIALTAHSESFRDLMSDLFAGIQGYRDLKARLYRILPSVMSEGFAGTLGLNRRSGSGLSADLLA